MALLPGARLGQYEIVSPLGSGGMGDVYRARDTRLDREVAVKVLSADLAGDAAALARFEREAMSVARLSHPNILAIHQFSSEGGVAFVVTELVDGETLRARLAHGALPVRRAVAYAHQIARGIAAAHARGVVHRDLKPENVMITRDDQVKILDFGLAKEIAAAAPDVTRVANHATSAGTVLGTFGYMAPEQVRAIAADHRADIFALGAVLYEMLSGQRAFTGETAADTMSAVLTREPPELDTARLAIPPALERVVRRCLEKAPELRFQSATDLAFALDTLSTSSSAAPTSAADPAIVSPPRRATPPAWLPWTIAIAASIAAAVLWMRPPPAVADVRWAAFTRISEAAGEEKGPTISPDGTTVMYAMRAGQSWDIYAQRVGGRNASAIVDDPTVDEGAPAFSPDGSMIAFHRSDATGGIFVAGATGESVRRVTDIGFDPAWSPDGRQIAFGTEEIVDPASRLGLSTLFVVDASGGTPRKAVDGDAVQPAWSPSGARIAYWSNVGGQRDLYTVSVQGGAPVRLTDDRALDWCPVWSPDGRFIYFASDRGTAMNLWRIAVDEASGAARGVPEPVTAGVQASAALPRFSKDGSRLVFRSRVGSINPVAIPFDPATLRAGTPVLLDTRNNIRIPSGVSPDGTLIAYFSIGEPQEDLFIGPADGGAIRRVTDDAWRDRAPVFAADGRSLLFYSNRETGWGIWAVGIDGGGLRRILVPQSGAIYAFPSPTGDEFAFIDDSGQSAYVASLTSPGTSRKLAGTATPRGGLSPTDWSADGARLAGYLVSPSGRPSGVARYDLAAAATNVFAEDETYSVKWLPDSRRLMYFTRNGWELVVIDTASRARTVIDVRLPGPSVADLFAIAPDGRTIYYGAARSEADIWIAESLRAR